MKGKKKETKGDRFALFALSELAWGTAWASFLGFTDAGKFMTRRRTWLTVVIGVGGTLAIARMVLPVVVLVRMLLAFVFSGLPLIIQGLGEEFNLDRVLLARGGDDA